MAVRSIWRDPKNWVAGEIVTERDMDTYISDNTQALYDATLGTEAKLWQPATNYEITISTQHEQNIKSIPITTKGGDIFFTASGNVSFGSGGNTIRLYVRLSQTGNIIIQNSRQVYEKDGRDGVWQSGVDRNRIHPFNPTIILREIIAGNYNVDFRVVNVETRPADIERFTIRDLRIYIGEMPWRSTLVT